MKPGSESDFHELGLGSFADINIFFKKYYFSWLVFMFSLLFYFLMYIYTNTPRRKHDRVYFQTAKHTKYICQTYKIYLPDIQDIFARHTRYICHTYKIYLPDIQDIFARHTRYICQTYKIYLPIHKNTN